MERIDTLNGLRVLSEAQNRRTVEIRRHSSQQIAEEDEDADNESPIFDSFYAADGNEGIMKMINLSAREFRRLYGELRLHIVAN